MDHQRTPKSTVKQKPTGNTRGRYPKTEPNGATGLLKKTFKVAPVVVKGLSNTSRRALDKILLEKLPTAKIENIIYNPNTKLYTIQPSDIHTFQQLLDNFPKDCFTEDKSPTTYVPTNIRQVIDAESECFLKGVDLEFSEDELHQALQNEGILIKQLTRLTRSADGSTTKKPTKTVKVICHDKRNRDTLLQTGLRISFCLFKCEPAKPNDIPVQCKKCNKFGHILKYCKAENEICARCGEQHSTVRCESSTVKCSNCNGDHEASSKQCRTFIERQKKMRQTIEEFTRPICQIQPPSTTQDEYPPLPSAQSKNCSCSHESYEMKFEKIAEQLKTTNELVLNLTTTVTQLMQAQQAILSILTQRQLTQTTGTQFMFQPPPTLAYRFPPPPPTSNNSPEQRRRPTKQPRRDEQTQPTATDKPFGCAALSTQTPKRTTRQAPFLPNSTSSPIITGDTSDTFRVAQLITPGTNTPMELDCKQ